MLSMPIPGPVLENIEYHASQPSTPVTLRQLYEYARTPDENTYIRAAQFLHKEMAIRIAKMVKELEAAPGDIGSVHQIQIVRDWYIRSFMDMTEFPYPRTPEDEAAFSEMVGRVKDRHRNQVAVMARGLRDYLDRNSLFEPSIEVQTFLDSFYLSRIGIRVLLGHHAASHYQRDGWVGIICGQTSPYDVALEAAEMAAGICRQVYGEPPSIEILGKTNLKFRYIPSHLRHIMFELLKNSFRASIECHREEGEKLPPVQVVIAGGYEDVSIKISDQGGGIPRSGVDRIWTYAYTTARANVDDPRSDGTVMAGLGYGLPLSRLYARYFGGELQIISLEGFGTDAYIHLNRLGNSLEYVL
jgi:pyruvate dehydrogenase kinase 2/3/4